MEKRLSLANSQESVAVLGRHDEYLRMINEHFTCRITARGEELIVVGEADAVNRVARLFQELLYLHREGNSVTAHDVRYGIRMVEEDQPDDLHRMFSDQVIVTHRGKHIKPKTVASHSNSPSSSGVLGGKITLVLIGSRNVVAIVVST